MTTLRRSSLEAAINSWVRGAVLPQLPIKYQIGIALAHDQIGRIAIDQLMTREEFFKDSNVIDKDGNFNAEALESGAEWFFENKEFVETREFFDIPLRLTKLNIQELLSAARRIESQTQAQ